MVQRESGKDAEHKRAAGVDDHRADGKRVRSSQADVMNDQRPENGADAPGRCDQQHQPEAGGGAHDGTSRFPASCPTITSATPPMTVAAR